MNLKTSELSANYASLKKQVEETLLKGRARAEKFVEKEKARTYWQVGRLIDQHIRKEKPDAERTTYGKRVIEKLSRDLKTNQTALYYCLRFARAYPILPALEELGWTHYRALLEVENTAQRKQLTQTSINENWTSRQLEAKVDELNKKTSINTKSKTAARFIPKRGILNAYRMDKEDYVDLGFSTFIQPDLKKLIGFKEHDILQVQKQKLVKLPNATRRDIYTYKAWVERVVDGDTIWMWIELGYKVCVRQKLRLRGLDAPEITTSAGERAKRFVEGALMSFPHAFSGNPKSGSPIKTQRSSAASQAFGDDTLIITTTKPDKFDRYLTDVFLGEAEDAPCLNQLLFEQGLAKLVSRIPENHWDESNTGRF